LRFAKDIITYASKLPKTTAAIEVVKQLVRAAGSIGANYIEASEAPSKKDFVMRIKISRKESKESRFWLELTKSFTGTHEECAVLIQEATELMKIFGSIIEKSK